MSLDVIACGRDEALSYAARWHRHHRPPQGFKLALAAFDEQGNVHGVALVGRPVSRVLDDGRTWEIVRVATDGTRNACSILYGAVGKIARIAGMDVITYTLPSEGGASLRAVGWSVEETTRTDGRGWSSRPGREDAHPEMKTRWALRCRRSSAPLDWGTKPPTPEQIDLFTPKETTP